MTTNGKCDPFKIVFDVLQSSLSGSVLVDSERRSISESPYDADILSSATERELHQSALSRLKNVKLTRELAMQRFASKQLLDTAKMKAIESNYCQAEASCLRHEQLTKRRLEQQLQGAERRMRELVFEIIGEYGKSEVRIGRRQDHLLHVAQLKLVGRISQFRWQRFSLRLCENLSYPPSILCNQSCDEQTPGKVCKINSKVLCHINDSTEITSVAASLGVIFKRHSLQISPAFKILAVVKLSRLQYRQKRAKLNGISAGSDSSSSTYSHKVINSDGRAPTQHGLSSHHRPDDSLLISTSAEFSLAFEHLLKWNEEDSSNNIGVSRIDKVDYDSNKFLNSNHIAWLHPPSFYPLLWGKIVGYRGKPENMRSISVVGTHSDSKQDEIGRVRHVSDIPGAGGSERGSWREECLDNFIARYSLQHTALLASDRIYFCLEERNLLTNGKKLTEDTSGGLMSRERLTLEAQGYLQDIYCQTADNGLKSDANGPMAAELLRNILTSDPLYVKEYLHVHRDAHILVHREKTESAESNPNKDAMSSSLDNFPDVIKVQTRSGKSMHFAPACPLNLMETVGFQDLFMSSCHTVLVTDDKNARVRQVAEEEEWITKVNANVSYPDIPSILSALRDSARIGRKGSAFIMDRLFCLVLVTPVPNLCSLTPQTGVAHERDPYQIMMPLSDPCMRELLMAALPPMDHQPLHSKNNQDALQLLPDHAGHRYSEYYGALTKQKSSSGADSLNEIEDTIPFNHKYVLLPGGEVTDKDATPLTASTDSYYIVQLDDHPISAAQRDDNPEGLHQSDALQNKDGNLSRFLTELTGDGLGPTHTTKLTRAMSSNSLLESQMRRISSEKNESQQSTLLTSTANPKIVNWVEEGGTQVVMNSPKKWDITVLSTLCRWRSCLCEGAKVSPFLCTYHSELKSFLDIRSFSNVQSDASKYLPRKILTLSSATPPSSSSLGPGSAANAVSSSMKDMTTIRAASTLLQELWDGKLRSTIKTFLKKTNHDMRFKIRLQAASSKAIMEGEKHSSSYIACKASQPNLVPRSAGENNRSRKVSLTSKTLRLPKPSGDPPHRLHPGNRGTNTHELRTNFLLSNITMPPIPGDPPWAVWKCKELFERCYAGNVIVIT